ncbi:ABC transporter ATP-binding protein [Marinomonas flavescens]|uniref:ABC transporter ATP-binding protein n=1 Tax=Marinomonas flavescens TaxID=2529379 RepID=UPI00105573E9|nr:ATP-binding cassette domain-containing protein [Marinomonas flavescens]
MTALIKVHDLTIHYQGKCLVNKVSFSVQQGRPLTILGQTGSGKTLVAKAIMGLLPSVLEASGTVEVFGKPVMAQSRSPLWGKSITMLPQEPWHSLDPLMVNYQQVSEVYESVKGEDGEAAFNHAIDDLTHLGLKGSALKRPTELSGGMAQRLAIASATAGGANLLIADEPTKGLDSSRRDDIIQLLQRSAQGGSLLTITHDIDVAQQLGGDILVIKDGEMIEAGSAESVLTNPQAEYTKALIYAAPQYWQIEKLRKTERKAILSVTDLTIGRGKDALASGLNLTCHTGEIIGVVGDSGCGKSTFGDTLLGLLPPLKGEIKPLLANTKSHQWLKLFQDPPSSLSAHVTLQTLLNDLVKLHKLDTQKIAPLMEKLNLPESILQRSAKDVSGGELQRFSILRALLLEPVFLFADEPTSRLDPFIAKEITELLIALAREQGCALLIVSHDPALIDKCCDTVIRLDQQKHKSVA